MGRTEGAHGELWGDRRKGFLSPSLREFLRGEPKTNPAEYRKRVRKGFRGALADYALVKASAEIDNEDLLKMVRDSPRQTNGALMGQMKPLDGMEDAAFGAAAAIGSAFGGPALDDTLVELDWFMQQLDEGEKPDGDTVEQLGYFMREACKHLEIDNNRLADLISD